MPKPTRRWISTVVMLEHKLILLIKLAFGIEVSKEELSISGIEDITKEDIDFASEIDAQNQADLFMPKR